MFAIADKPRTADSSNSTSQLAAELTARSSWTRRRLLAHQSERLQATLRHAVSASPYYRETIGHLVARGAPLEVFPVLTKSQLVAEFDRIVTDRRLRLADIERHLSSEHAGDLMF